MEHELDISVFFCLHCGESAERIVDGKAPKLCAASENVVAISHILSRKKFKNILGGLSSCRISCGIMVENDD